MTFVVGPHSNGRTIEMVVRGQWSDEARRAFEAASADSLLLNYMHGFDMPNLDFLRDVPVRHLTILDRRLTSLAPIHDLGPTLESLSLEVDPALPLDLERLPHLTKLGCNWSQIEKTFPAAVGLQHLHANQYNERTLAPLTTAGSLRSIVMKHWPNLHSLDGLSELPDLRQLEVYIARNLADTDALRLAPGLEELQLESCRRITMLDNIASCTNLTFLNLSEGATFPDAEPLRALTNLQELYLYGSTKFTNGDLTPIVSLPNLRELRLQDRRHYRPRASEVRTLIAGRTPGCMGGTAR